MFEEESRDFRANVEEARMSDILLDSCVVALLQDKCGFAGRDWAAALFMPRISSDTKQGPREADSNAR